MNNTPGLPTEARPKRSSSLIGPDQDRTNRRVSPNFRTSDSVPSLVRMENSPCEIVPFL
ncbi:hypothetical protein PILCRDRAFT_821521, partial [Piloderma croceum F 1598]